MLNIVSMGDYITFTRSYYEDSSDSDDYHTSISSSFDYFDWKSDISDECSLSNENDVEGNQESKRDESIPVHDYKREGNSSETPNNVEHNRNSTNNIDNCGDSTTEQNSIEGNEDESYKEDFIDICNNTIGQEPSDESGGVNKSTTNIIKKRCLSDSIEDMHSNCGHQTGKVKKQKPNRNC